MSVDNKVFELVSIDPRGLAHDIAQVTTTDVVTARQAVIQNWDLASGDDVVLTQDGPMLKVSAPTRIPSLLRGMPLLKGVGRG